MMKFDHLALPVSNLDRSRDWYIATLGLKVEFEIPARHAVALQDGEGFALFLEDAWLRTASPCGSRSRTSTGPSAN